MSTSKGFVAYAFNTEELQGGGFNLLFRVVYTGPTIPVGEGQMDFNVTFTGSENTSTMKQMITDAVKADALARWSVVLDSADISMFDIIKGV